MSGRCGGGGLLHALQAEAGRPAGQRPASGRARERACVAAVLALTARPAAAPSNRLPRRSTLAGVLNIAGMLFASTLFVGFTNSMTVQHTIEVQRNVFYR